MNDCGNRCAFADKCSRTECREPWRNRTQPAISEYQRGLNAAASIADLYASENLQLAADTAPPPSMCAALAFHRMIRAVEHCGAAKAAAQIADAVRHAATHQGATK